ncbi:MAG: ribbon-helix-helix domain-containing protein [Dermatophilaceae bacterium]
MKVSVPVRLGKSLVVEIDALVRSGAARSRSELVESALEREVRRRLDERDAAILAERAGEPDDLDGLIECTVDHPTPVD